ncbi:MAG: hypothetical protein RL685_6409 [Pseudomonadota bacterium]|jgi:hypothetical protein
MNEQANRSGALEERAARARLRLEHSLDELDERKERLVEAAKGLTKPPASIIVGAAVGLAATAFIVQRVRARRRRTSFRGLLETRTEREKSFLVQGLQNAGLSLLTLFIQRLGARGVDRLLGQADGLPHAGLTGDELPADPRPYRAGQS